MQTVFNGTPLNGGIIHTNDQCRGCNKCLSSCPIFGANIAWQEEGANKIGVDHRLCILCGRCIDACAHGARAFEDDTSRFLTDLTAVADGRRKRGISLIVAPSFVINYPNRYKMILGYLKHLGVNHIYSVSFGADITIWGYLNYMAGNDTKGMIAQPCPAIVQYIETHRPELLPRLIPVQSPAMCAAIYLKKYQGLTDDIAFLGPCIAKKSEFERPQNDGMVQYNVTFEHLMKAIGNEDLSMYTAEDSELEYGMGAMFSMHGGMRENLEFYLGLEADGYINQKEGENYSYSFLDLYANRLDYDDPYRADLIDILNCSRGCNYGTATEFRNTSSNHIPYAVNQMRVKKSQREFPELEQMPDNPKERLEALNKRFSELKIEDFFASYRDESLAGKEVGKKRIGEVFKKMYKITEAEQTMDCSACGMRSCKEMATAIALGYNYEENCIHYVKKKLLIEQSESLIQRQKYELLQASRSTNKSENIDQLTGFQNRYGFEQQLEKSLRQAHQTGLPGYLIMMDLDDFKNLNESYGPEFGNSLLVKFSLFLRTTFGEAAEIFRVGGDEFVLLVENSTVLEARRITDTVLQKVQTAWEIFGIRFYCTVSIGVARFPYQDGGANGIMQNVELAMFAAKKNGKNNCVFFTEDIQQDTQGSVEMIRHMRDAVARDFEGFYLVFQPWVRPDGYLVGCEALLRWNSDGKNISPATFIPIAESTGLIVPLGEFVLREAAKACRAFSEIQPGFLVSINVSSKQLEKSDVYDRFLQILNETGVDRHQIVLEVTESVHLERTETTKELFDRFVKSGLTIALDDFGTGYSSLSYLSELPFELIKIDRSFINNIESDNYSRHLITMITDLMHKMGRCVCVEGVEEEHQLDFCREQQADIIQGFYYYKPMPPEDLQLLLQKEGMHSLQETVSVVRGK